MPPADPADRTATLAPRDATPAPAPAPAPAVGDVDGDLPVNDPERYEQVAEQGRGGLGRVVRAVDKRLGRTVAVKELLRNDDWHEARFVREALITARLEHPGIVPVHEAGRWPNGAPYYVMKLVEGRTLKELMAGHTSWRERVELLPHIIAIADAVGYAHSEGVIHRDLKPSNVIVGSFGETIVIDWGLARDCKRDIPEPQGEMAIATGSGVSTVSGKIVGTPAYMAPEQARGEPVDERADVYAIGAVLYELLAGKAPHADETPQSALDRVIAGPPAPLPHVAAGAPTELCDIVAKAMARHPGDRYANAKELAEDLRRFSTGKLVSAHAYTPWQIVTKKIKQHRGIVVVAAASAIALATMGVESFRKVVTERDIAQAERTNAVRAQGDAERLNSKLVLVQAGTSLRKDPTAALAWLKRHKMLEGETAQVVDIMDEAIAAGVSRHVFRPGDWVFDAQFTPDGKTIVAAVRNGDVLRYDVESGEHAVIGHAPSAPEALAISPDGQLAVTGGTVGEVIAWPIDASSKPKTLVAGGLMVDSIAFDPAGTKVLVSRYRGPAEVVPLAGKGEPIGPDSALKEAVARDDWSKRIVKIAPNELALGDGKTVVARTERSIAFFKLSPSGDSLVLHDGSTVWIAPIGGPLEKLAPFSGELVDVTWAPDGKSVLIFGKVPELYWVDLATRTMKTLRGHTDSIYMAQFTADSRGLLTAGDDGTARIWNLADGSSIALLGHDDDVYRARFSPSEELAVTASLDGSIRVWHVPRKQPGVLAEGQPILDMAVSDNSVVVQTETTISRWKLDPPTRDQLFAVGPHDGSGIGTPSPDGKKLLVQKPSLELEIRSKDTPPIELRGHKGQISRVAWSADNRYVYSASYDGTLRRWDATTGAATLLVDGKKPVTGFAVSADGRIAAMVGDTAIMIHPDGHQDTLVTAPVNCLKGEFEPAGNRLLIHRCDNTLLLIDGTHTVQLPTEGYAVSRIAFSPDGHMIAGAAADRTVRVWDDTGRTYATLKGHQDLVEDVAFSPDGRQLASAAYDRTIRIWQLGSDRHRVLRGHTGPVMRVAWRGPHELISASVDGTLRLWQVPPLDLPSQSQVTARLDAATSARIDDSNESKPTTL